MCACVWCVIVRECGSWSTRLCGGMIVWFCCVPMRGVVCVATGFVMRVRTSVVWLCERCGVCCSVCWVRAGIVCVLVCMSVGRRGCAHCG